VRIDSYLAATVQPEDAVTVAMRDAQTVVLEVRNPLGDRQLILDLPRDTAKDACYRVLCAINDADVAEAVGS